MEINDKIQTLQKSRWWDKGILVESYIKHTIVMIALYTLFVLIQHVIKCMTAMVSMCGILDLMNVHYIDQID